MAIGKAIGRLFHIDNTTTAMENGYYAMVLCGTDLAVTTRSVFLLKLKTNMLTFGKNGTRKASRVLLSLQKHWICCG